MRDETFTPQQRLDAARLAAPYVHSKPQPEPRIISLALPETIGTAAELMQAHADVLRATAAGTLALEDARDLSAVLETHRRLVETVDLEARIAKLEAQQK